VERALLGMCGERRAQNIRAMGHVLLNSPLYSGVTEYTSVPNVFLMCC
jgi:hypothetical protein